MVIVLLAFQTIEEIFINDILFIASSTVLS